MHEGRTTREQTATAGAHSSLREGTPQPQDWRWLVVLRARRWPPHSSLRLEEITRTLGWRGIAVRAWRQRSPRLQPQTAVIPASEPQPPPRLIELQSLDAQGKQQQAQAQIQAQSHPLVVQLVDQLRCAVGSAQAWLQWPVRKRPPPRLLLRRHWMNRRDRAPLAAACACWWIVASLPLPPVPPRRPSTERIAG